MNDNDGSRSGHVEMSEEKKESGPLGWECGF